MKKKYYHQKLIRDRIPEKIKESGDEYETRVLDRIEFESELKRKLVEESKELAESSKEGLLNELADVLELTKSVASHYKIHFPRWKSCGRKKERKEEDSRKSYSLFGQLERQVNSHLLSSKSETWLHFLYFFSNLSYKPKV